MVFRVYRGTEDTMPNSAFFRPRRCLFGNAHAEGFRVSMAGAESDGDGKGHPSF